MNPKFIFTFHYLSFVYSLFLYRAGIRQNNFQIMLAARSKCSDLFFILNPPKYREIYHRDMLQRVQAPPEVLTYIEQHEAFSPSGDTSRGEGGDFVLEDANKKVKALLPPGPPSPHHWTISCWSVDRLTQVKIFVACTYICRFNNTTITHLPLSCIVNIYYLYTW